MKLKSIASLFLLTITIISCAQNNSNKATNDLTISTKSFSVEVAQTGAQILDVRTAAEFQSGHIANALQANWLDPKEFKSRTQHLDKSKKIYIYCQSGGRSASAQAALMEAGFKVVNLEGGMSNWRKQQMPVEGAGNTLQMRVSDFKKVVDTNHYVLVDIGAVWCPPCRKMQPIIDALKQTPPKPFIFLAVDGGQDIDVMKLLNANELPTFILYKNGFEIWRKVGVAEKDDFVKAFDLPFELID